MMYVPEPQWKLPEYTWGKEQETCKQCKHYLASMTGRAYNQSVAMRCKLHDKSRVDKLHGTCIDMRYGGRCGRSALLFEQKQP